MTCGSAGFRRVDGQARQQIPALLGALRVAQHVITARDKLHRRAEISCAASHRVRDRRGDQPEEDACDQAGDQRRPRVLAEEAQDQPDEQAQPGTGDDAAAEHLAARSSDPSPARPASGRRRRSSPAEPGTPDRRGGPPHAAPRRRSGTSRSASPSAASAAGRPARRGCRCTRRHAGSLSGMEGAGHRFSFSSIRRRRILRPHKAQRSGAGDGAPRPLRPRVPAHTLG